MAVNRLHATGGRYALCTMRIGVGQGICARDREGLRASLPPAAPRLGSAPWGQRSAQRRRVRAYRFQPGNFKNNTDRPRFGRAFVALQRSVLVLVLVSWFRPLRVAAEKSSRFRPWSDCSIIVFTCSIYVRKFQSLLATNIAFAFAFAFAVTAFAQNCSCGPRDLDRLLAESCCAPCFMNINAG